LVQIEKGLPTQYLVQPRWVDQASKCVKLYKVLATEYLALIRSSVEPTHSAKEKQHLKEWKKSMRKMVDWCEKFDAQYDALDIYPDGMDVEETVNADEVGGEEEEDGEEEEEEEEGEEGGAEGDRWHKICSGLNSNGKKCTGSRDVRCPQRARIFTCLH
jgi:hypothetical protein